MLCSLLFPLRGRGARWYVQSGLLDVQGSFKNKRQELAELLIPCAAFLEPLLTYLFMMSVLVRKCTTNKDELRS